MQTTPASSSPFSAAPQGYALAGSQTYAPPGLPANANSSNPATDAAFYGNAIDPALGGAGMYPMRYVQWTRAQKSVRQYQLTPVERTW